MPSGKLSGNNDLETLAECHALTPLGVDETKVWVADGMVKYHRENVGACLDVYSEVSKCKITGLSLALADKVAATCAEVFEGLVAEGGACFDDRQCASRNCQQVDPTCKDACCAGICGAAITPLAVPKIGEACPDGTCPDGAYCQWDAMGNNTTCAAQVGAGEPCDSFEVCVSSTYCDFDLMTGKNTCKLRPSLGEPCNAMSIFFPCDRTDLTCNTTTKVCTLRKTEGQPCMDTIECLRYANCDSTTMKCVKQGDVGATCGNEQDCLSPLQCDAGTCALPTHTICK